MVAEKSIAGTCRGLLIFGFGDKWAGKPPLGLVVVVADLCVELANLLWMREFVWHMPCVWDYTEPVAG